MDRLTQYKKGHAYGAEGASVDELTGAYCRGAFDCTAIVEKLAEYEDLDEQGKLLRLPCKIGDTVYFINKNQHGLFVDAQYVDEVSDQRIWADYVCFDYSDIGKMLFLTRESAEVKLREMEGNT